ncbi:MAG: hypothetical protein FWE40_10155 [Oscillospiraceae bacterium]|jgi:hypothetical protein|nr:hypothetical protein [Oscillospiraceae bacterium]
MRNHYRNHAYYYDPTAGEAILNISREEYRRRRKRDKRVQRTFELGFDRTQRSDRAPPQVAAEEVPKCNR